MKNLITLFITLATLTIYSGLAYSMDTEGLDVTISVMESDPHDSAHEIDLPGHDDVANHDIDEDGVEHDADDNDDDGVEREADDHEDANEQHDTAEEDHEDTDENHVEDGTSGDDTPAV